MSEAPLNTFISLLLPNSTQNSSHNYQTEYFNINHRNEIGLIIKITEIILLNKRNENPISLHI